MRGFQICISNIVQHDLTEHVKDLLARGYPIQVEPCLDLCGACRHTPLFVRGQEIVRLRGGQDMQERMDQLMKAESVVYDE